MKKKNRQSKKLESKVTRYVILLLQLNYTILGSIVEFKKENDYCVITLEIIGIISLSLIFIIKELFQKK